MPVYDNDIKDIMGDIPGRILRIGLFSIFAIVLLIFIGLYFFKSPELIKCPITLTTINPPSELYAQSTGKIEHLYFTEKDQVNEGSIIAIISNTARYSDVLWLKNELQNLNNASTLLDSIILNYQLPNKLVLGELQNNFTKLYKIILEFQYYLNHNYIAEQITLLNEKMEEKCLHNLFLNKQKDLGQLYLSFVEKQYHRDTSFYSKNKEAVSLVDLENKTKNYLEEKNQFINYNITILQQKEEILNLKGEKMNLFIKNQEEVNNYKIQMSEAIELLYEDIRQWEKKYAITSSIVGQITFTGYWSKNQTIREGERLATIIPLDSIKIIGRAFIGMDGIGKVRVGQKANIKLNGFPYVEYGILKGRVNTISMVPEKEKGYLAEITLTNGMLSTYKTYLQFIHDMEGEVEIVTKDQRLIFRLIKPLLKLFS